MVVVNVVVLINDCTLPDSGMGGFAMRQLATFEWGRGGVSASPGPVLTGAAGPDGGGPLQTSARHEGALHRRGGGQTGITHRAPRRSGGSELSVDVMRGFVE